MELLVEVAYTEVSYSVETDLLSLSLSALVCVVKPETIPQLCKTDEIGEICVSSIATGTSYYGLTGMTKNMFEVWIFSLLQNFCFYKLL